MSFSVGDTKSIVFDLSPVIIDDFAALSGDDNALHMSDQHATGRGFTGRVVHGVCLLSGVSRLIGKELPGENALIQKIDVLFRSPAYASDRITIVGTVTHVSEATRTLEVKFTATNQNGKRVMTGKVQVGVLAEKGLIDSLATSDD